MSHGAREWYQRPGPVIGAIAGLIVISVLIYFGTQIAHYMVLIKSGSFDPETGLQKQQLQQSVSSRFTNTTVTAQDLSRIVPKGPVPTLGSPSATVQIVEFLDYECPYCGQTAPALRAFMSRHAKDAHLLIRDFPLVDIHPDAENAAIAADCVFRIAPARYWLYHDRLFSDQSALSPADLRQYAQDLSIDLDAYDACVQASMPLADISRSIEDGQAAGVQGTPTFFFNGVKVAGAMDEQALEVVLKEAQAHAAP